MHQLLLAFSLVFFALAAIDYAIYLRRHRVFRRGELFLNLHNVVVSGVFGWLVQFSLLALVLTFSYRQGQHLGTDWLATGVFGWDFILALLLVDLAYYLKHLGEHRFRWLWLSHRIHHSPSEYHGLITLRNSPYAALNRLPFLALLAMLGISPALLLLHLGFSGFYQNISHLSFLCRPTFLDGWIVTPFVHRAHHSPSASLHDCNFGGIFLFWDRLFGTYRPVREAGEVEVGLAEPLSVRDNLVANYTLFWRG